MLIVLVLAGCAPRVDESFCGTHHWSRELLGISDPDWWVDDWCAVVEEQGGGRVAWYEAMVPTGQCALTADGGQVTGGACAFPVSSTDGGHAEEQWLANGGTLSYDAAADAWVLDATFDIAWHPLDPEGGLGDLLWGTGRVTHSGTRSETPVTATWELAPYPPECPIVGCRHLEVEGRVVSAANTPQACEDALDATGRTLSFDYTFAEDGMVTAPDLAFRSVGTAELPCARIGKVNGYVLRFDERAHRVEIEVTGGGCALAWEGSFEVCP